MPEGATAENSYTVGGIRYDATKKWIKVTVADDGEGHLTVTKDPNPAQNEPDGTWTNEQLGKLTVTKTVKLNGAEDTTHSDVTFYVGMFESADAASAISGTVKQITVAPGSATASVTYEELTIGQTYYVYETDSAGNKLNVNDKTQGYTVTENGGESAAITLTPVVNVDVANDRQLGDLIITKSVAGTDEANEEFTFSVTLSETSGAPLAASYATVKTSAAGEETSGTQEVTSGRAFTVTLKAGETWKMSGLPAGTGYEVSEQTPPAGYTEGTHTAASGTIPAGTAGANATVTAAMNNTYSATGTVDFHAKKEFTNGTLGNPEFAFRLTQVTGKDSTTPAAEADIGTGEGGIPALKLASPETKTTTETSGTTETVDFDTITFTKDSTKDETGEYWFLVEEVLPEGAAAENNYTVNGVRYDPEQKWIKVTVEDDGKGNLTVNKAPSAEEESPDGTWTNEQLGSLEITKEIRKNGNLDASATGEFWYAVYTEAYDASAEPAQVPVRTGSIEVTENGTTTVTEADLPYRTYYVYELTGENGTPIVSGEGGTVAVLTEGVYTVSGSGTGAEVGSEPGQAELVNDVKTIDIPVLKTWSNGTFKAGDYVKIGLYAADGTTAINEPGTQEPYVLTIGYDAGTNAWPTEAVSFENVPMYDEQGNAITYKVVETEVKRGGSTLTEATLIKTVYGSSDGSVVSTSEIQPQTITNTVSYKTYKVKKTWGEGQQPPEGAIIEITLSGTANSAAVDLSALGVTQLTVTLDGTTEIPAWEYEWTGLPYYDNAGNEITYSANETKVTIDGTTWDAGAADAGENPYLTATDTTVPGTTKFTNDYTSHTVTKTWSNVEGSDGYVVQMQLNQNNAPYGTVILTSADNWTYTWNYLPVYTATGQDAVYTAEEIGVYTVSDVEDGEIKQGAENLLEGHFYTTTTHGEGTTSVTNKLFTVNLEKVSSRDQSKKLAGAKFKLNKWNGEEYTAYRQETETDSDGAISWTNLPVGSYEIEETEAPDGFNGLEKTIKFSIAKSNGEFELDTEDSDPHASRIGNTFAIMVENEPGSLLPVTGGPGTAGIRAIGAMLALAALALLMKRRKGAKG